MNASSSVGAPELRFSSSAVPSAMSRPFAMKPMREQRRSVSAMSCEVRRIVVPCSRLSASMKV